MTTGADIVGTLLRDHPDLVAVVPIERIKLGALPEGVDLPAVLIRQISSVERQALIRGATTRTIDRIAITVRAASYRQQREVVSLCCRRIAGLTGDIGGGIRASILSAGIGPDLQGPGNSFEKTCDFRVSYDA